VPDPRTLFLGVLLALAWPWEAQAPAGAWTPVTRIGAPNLQK